MKWDTPIIARTIESGELISELDTMRRWFREFDGKIVWQESTRYDTRKQWGCLRPRVTRVQRELIKYSTDEEIILEENYIRNGLYDIGRGEDGECEEDLSEDDELGQPSTSVKNEPLPAVESYHAVPKAVLSINHVILMLKS